MALSGLTSRLSLEDQDGDSKTGTHNPTADQRRMECGALGRIYHCTPIPTIVLDASMRIIEVSEGYQTISRRSRDSLLHLRIFDSAVLPTQDVPALCIALHMACFTKKVQAIQRIFMDGNGPYRIRIIPIYDKSILISVVLEAERVAEETSQDQHDYVDETYKMLLNTVKHFAIFMLDQRGHITTWTSGATGLMGYSTDEILGKPFSIFWGAQDRANNKPDKALAICLGEGRFEDEGWRYRRDGSRFWANVLIMPIYQSGQHVGFVKATRDLTESKEAEERMITAFETSSRLKTDFLANMSHEIRTPMNGMNLALTLLLEGAQFNEQQREYALILKDSMSDLLKVVNDILDYSKLSSGSFSLHSDVLDVEGLLTAVVQDCKSSAKPGVELSITVPPDFPRTLHGDPVRYRQILQNLIENAVKFTECGLITVSASFWKEQNADCYTVTTEVTDTGIGVSDFALNTLFMPFMRLADCTAKKYRGTGLGLAICQSLAELMDGTLGYRKGRDGKGSVFWFTAKFSDSLNASSARPSRDLVAGRHVDIAKEIRPVAERKHILLVEDDLVNHTIMLKLLRNMGFNRIDGAWNGKEAVGAVKEKPVSYDIILMDICMPVMDGMTATRLIRETKADMPIIAVTGNAVEGDAEVYLAIGMNDYIGKPVHRDRLLQVLWKWMGT